MKFNKKLLYLSLVFLTQLHSQIIQCSINDTLLSAFSADDILIKSCNGLNALIAQGNMYPPLSLREQKHYIEWYIQFKQAVDFLKNQGDDVSELEQMYLSRYQEWADQLITDSTIMSDFSEKIAVVNYQGKDESLSPEQQAFDELRSEKMKNIYDNIQASILKIQKTFSVNVKAQLNNLKSYSKGNARAFTDYLESSLRGFVGSMRVIKMSAYADYYSFLEEHGKQSEDPREITPDERYLFDSVETITQEAILQIRALILDMTSAAVSTEMGRQIAEALKESEAQAKKDYDAQLAQNVAEFNPSWWDGVKATGSVVLDEFSNRFEDELKKEVVKQIKKSAVKYGAQAVKKIVDPISEQLSQLSGKLEHENLSQLYKDYGDPALKALKRTIKIVNPVIDKPLDTESVVVQSGVDLCDDEKEYVANRMAKVQKVLKTDFDIDQPLRIAFCCSGGGNRAMIGTLGLFIAASRHKFLDVSLYMAGLSGSTWTIVPWSYLYLKNSFKSKDFETTLTTMLGSLAPALQDGGMLKPPFLRSDVTSTFSRSMAVRFGYGMHLSAVDIFGSLVGNYALNLVGNSRLSVTWSSLAVSAKSGRIPLPLASAAFNPGTKTETKTPVGSSYEWFEMSPFQAGSSVLGYIPTRWLGSEFKDGKIVSEFTAPEYPISFYLGVYGSAFGLSLHDVVDKGLPETSFNVNGVKVVVPVDEWVKEILQESFGKDAGTARSGKIHARFPNFSAGSLRSILQNEKELRLFDGGIAFNFPLPLLLDRPERAVDVIIIYDSNPGDVPVFKDAEKYFKRKNIAIPDLSAITKVDSAQAKKDLLKSIMTVFNDPRTVSYNSKIPTFIYFPTRPPMDGKPGIDISKAPFTTANFGYSEQDVMTLAKDMEDAFESQVPVMKNILKMVAQKKYALTIDTKVVNNKKIVPIKK